MSITRNSFKRPAALFAAVALTASLGISVYLSQVAYAVATQVSSRSIQLSDSAPSGGTITTGVGSGTAVEYAVQFTTVASTHNIGAVVVDVCASSPLIGDTTCTLPAGFNWGAATPTLKGGSLSGLSGFTTGSMQGAGAGAATPQVLTLTNGTPQSVNASTVIKFTIQGVVNPTTTGTFYARILTFDTSAHMTSEYTTTGTARAATFTDNADYGGIAMSTTAPIVVTARVMESLLLCTSAAAFSGLACAGATTPSVIIGHGSPTAYIDTSAVDTTAVYTQISTNASGGYAVYLRGSNTSCGGLSRDGGTTCGIPAVSSGTATPAAITAGTAAFGMKFTAGSAHAGGTGTNTAVAKWNGTGGYLMDTVTANDNVTYVYGSKVIDGAAQQANSVENTITLGATASASTPAGIYTENFSLIGVGTF